ncbi:methionine--tRNA ligase [Iocasia frigidifontis]|uniref:Methionine--tRNA ligase n=1 Tax=Iocasia fonsfrigidae TaxID=2682810 RepID=A0A8A7KCY3_9FIRM|nr:methionine--tRNA ligase [Iocasia fonsfrigidae]QTL97468.1 methionine--tRNA ligase [Iocasia fonsfrigidae]
MSVFIGGAWPYANGSLHLGHIASLLPGDILARYYRLKGEDVLYVSGSDCHGTPIALRANNENIAPEDITNRYHQEFRDCFRKLGFTYDLYTRTDQPVHYSIVQKIFRQLLEKDYIYKKGIEQLFCENCNQYLPDRYVEGICPICGAIARGDQCDTCSSLIEPLELKERVCKLCGGEPVVKGTEQFYFALAKFGNQLNDILAKSPSEWRDNAIKLTKRYLQEGLKDRAVTRDLSWGISVPIKEYEEKKIYVWIEAVLGYLSASMQWAEETNSDWQRYWGEDVTAYYVHGKDNIPFHTLILPALLLGIGNLHLPDKIISSEYLTIEGRKLSTSKNWAVWVPCMLERYNPDSIRYYLSINGPEKRDCNFSWEEFINSHNGELLAAYGNFVNRTLVFVEKYYDSKVPASNINSEIKRRIIALYEQVGNLIEKGEFKESLESIFSFIRRMNKYFDEEKPWISVKENMSLCKNTIYTCVQSIINLSNLLNPFLPFSSQKLRDMMNLDKAKWSYIELEAKSPIRDIKILFKRIDKERIKEERQRLLMNGVE